MYLEEKDGVLKIKQEHLDKLNELKKQKDELDKELKALSGGITKEIQETCDETTPFGEYNFVKKGGYYSIEFDLDSFKNEHPYLYLDFLKPVFVKESFSLVSATRSKKNG